MRTATLLLLVGLLLAGTHALAEPRPANSAAAPAVFADLALQPEEGPSRVRQSFAARQIAQCCKICRKGKACGDSCIRKSYTCHKPPGCACDASP